MSKWCMMGFFPGVKFSPWAPAALNLFLLLSLETGKKLEQWRKEKVLNRCIKWVGIYLLQCLYIPSLIGSEWFTLAGWP